VYLDDFAAYQDLFGRNRKQRPENFLGALSNSGPAVRLYSEGRGPAHLKTVTGDVMSRNIWLLFTILMTTTYQQRTKPCPAISTRSTTR
jgi:hypothetical protein